MRLPTAEELEREKDRQRERDRREDDAMRDRSDRRERRGDPTDELEIKSWGVLRSRRYTYTYAHNIHTNIPVQPWITLNDELVYNLTDAF